MYKGNNKNIISGSWSWLGGNKDRINTKLRQGENKAKRRSRAKASE